MLGPAADDGGGGREEGAVLASVEPGAPSLPPLTSLASSWTFLISMKEPYVMPDRLVSRMELGSLPFRRRPVAEPGTTLVFHMADGQLVEPTYPYTTGDTWWRGPKAAYVVDITPHVGGFECELPSSAGAVYFSATVAYSWSVHDAARVVQEQVGDPDSECRGYLKRRLPSVTSRFPPDRTMEARQGVQIELGREPIELERGIRIRDLDVQLRMDREQAELAKDLEIGKLRQELTMRDAKDKNEIAGIDQSFELLRQRERESHYTTVVAGGKEQMMAVVMAQDPSKAPEILSTMIGLSERQEQRTLEAIKVLIDGGEIRLGELDGAVRAAVERISGILGNPTDATGRLGSESSGEAEKALPSPDDTGQDGGS